MFYASLTNFTFFLFSIFFFFFNDTATTEIYTLSLHDALPILEPGDLFVLRRGPWDPSFFEDRKSTRLNSSHVAISYAVFCLKKKKKKKYEYEFIKKNTKDTLKISICG